MPRQIAVGYTDKPKDDYERQRPIVLYDLGPVDQKIRLTEREAWELLRGLVNTLQGYHNRT